jgi:hypothetical protein
MRKLVYLCDWLPPDFGAVGQYLFQYATEAAHAGNDVVLVGLSSSGGSVEQGARGAGRLTILRLHARPYERHRFARRALWTLSTNGRLLWYAWEHLRFADRVLFTGSPPFLLHFLVPLNGLLRRRLVYRITDFHPECLMAALERVPRPLRWFHRLTVALRRRVQQFEVLGEDQRRLLRAIGIPDQRITLRRDPSPVRIPAGVEPLPAPKELDGYCLLLYSGNLGVAHDYQTFAEGYRRHHRHGSGRVALWLNATGARADALEQVVRAAGLPVHRSRPLPLEQLPRLLVTPHVHLITLRDAFVGYVMPSKVYGCIESGRDVLYVGSAASDVHLLCSEGLSADAYRRVDAGDADGVARALEAIADRADHRPAAFHERKTNGLAARVTAGAGGAMGLSVA